MVKSLPDGNRAVKVKLPEGSGFDYQIWNDKDEEVDVRVSPLSALLQKYDG